MKRHETLHWRLVAASSAWVIAALLISGLALVLFFRDHIERRFDGTLRDHLEELVAASEVGTDTALRLSWRPFDPRFNRPRSGWYWQVRQDGRVVARSDSLWRSELAFRAERNGERSAYEFTGPVGESLRAVEQLVTLPRSTSTFSYAVAGPVADIDSDVDRFTLQIAATMTLLAAGLLAAIVFQVRFGLKPLGDLRKSLSAVRGGSAERLAGNFPEEVSPLVDELNALLERNAGMLERARAHAADLAHALKNPLTVIKNESAELPGTIGDVLRKETAAMVGAIDRHLSRARAAGGSVRPGQRTDIDTVVEDIRYSLDRLYRDRELELEVAGLDGRVFLGDRQDLEEMLGNLMDNACKWAQRRVLIRAEGGEGRLSIHIEDDGPGLPSEEFEDVLSRGTRMDETIPGSGMGLGIVRDLAEAYGGSIRLSSSSLGGLRASLLLPSANESP